jgi:hypothetical protein
LCFRRDAHRDRDDHDHDDCEDSFVLDFAALPTLTY